MNNIEQLATVLPVSLAFIWSPIKYNYLPRTPLKTKHGFLYTLVTVGALTEQWMLGHPKNVQELPKKCDKELKLSMWPQDRPDPNVIEHPREIHGGPVVSSNTVLLAAIVTVRSCHILHITLDSFGEFSSKRSLALSGPKYLISWYTFIAVTGRKEIRKK